jgi:hypothetical protein
MKRIFSAALLCLVMLASPAVAATALITGTGTGNSQGMFVNTGSVDTTLTMTAAVPVGALNVALCAARQALTWTSVTDSAGNTWSPALASTNNGSQTVRIFYSVNTINLPIGGTVKCTGNTASGQHAIVVASVSGNSATPLDPASVAQTGTSGTFTDGPTGTLAYPGGANSSRSSRQLIPVQLLKTRRGQILEPTLPPHMQIGLTKLFHLALQ